MKKAFTLFETRVVGVLFLCSLIILQFSATSRAKFLDPKDAKSIPRGRVASYATSTIGIVFLNPNKLGPHSYRHSLRERNGIVYTCKGGHIDITHLRKFADWTGYFTAQIFEGIKNGRTEFSWKMRERSRYFLQLTYPQDWQQLSQVERERIAVDVSIESAQYLAYTSGVWHEILTWFGFKAIGIYPEYPSAFAWEDIYSNLIGCYVGAQALRDTEHEFDEAVTLAIKQELEKLGVQSSRTARRAAAAMRGEWFTGDLMFVKIKARNLDVGLDDGFVTPWIVSSVSKCEGARAQPYPVPNLDFISRYGFVLKYEIEPREWEKKEILKIVYPDEEERKDIIEPAVHFAAIMDYIKEDAFRKYGDVSPDYVKSDALMRSHSQQAKSQFLAYGGDSQEGSDELTQSATSSDSVVSNSGNPPCKAPVRGDVSGDCKVDLRDLEILALRWLRNRQNTDLVPIN